VQLGRASGYLQQAGKLRAHQRCARDAPLLLILFHFHGPLQVRGLNEQHDAREMLQRGFVQ
jgi:hypothetical protein